MADPNDDLFSDLDAIEAPKPSPPPARTVPNLADSLRDLGLFEDEAEPEQEVEPVPPVFEPVAVPEPPVVLAPAVEPVVEPEADPPHYEEADEEPAAELHSETDAPFETPTQAEEDPAPVVVQPSPVQVEQPVDEAPAVGSTFPHRRVWILGGAVVACALSGWLLFGSSNKESTVQPPQPVATEPAPAPVAEPVVVAAPEVVEPEPAPVVDPVPVPLEPAPAPPAKPAVAAVPKPAAPKPQRAPEPKPVAKPKPEPQWQDKAMDALDDLEKRL